MTSSSDVTLIALAAEHLPLTRAWRNRADIARCFFGGAVTAAQHEQWFVRYEQDPTDYTFIIQWQGRPVGMVAVYNIDTHQGRAEFGRLMIGDDAARGRGVARAACAQLAAMAFAEFGVRVLYLEVFADNEPAVRVYESLGFERTDEAERTRAGGRNPEAVLVMELHKSCFEKTGAP